MCLCEWGGVAGKGLWCQLRWCEGNSRLAPEWSDREVSIIVPLHFICFNSLSSHMCFSTAQFPFLSTTFKKFIFTCILTALDEE